MRVFPSDFDGALVGFRARIAEKCTVEPAEFDEFRGGVGLGLRVIEIGNVNDAGGLIGNGVDERLVTVSEHVDRNAAEKIYILFAVDGINVRTFAVVDNQFVTVEDGQIRFLIPIDNLLSSLFQLNSSNVISNPPAPQCVSFDCAQ